jgi:hypothetical protein
MCAKITTYDNSAQALLCVEEDTTIRRSLIVTIGVNLAQEQHRAVNRDTSLMSPEKTRRCISETCP